MLIAAVSDTHSLFPNLPESDIILATGDLLPDHQFQTTNFNKLAKKQEQWVRDHIDQYKKWIGNRPFFSVGGNHDRIDHQLFVNILKSANISVFNITNKLVKYKGINIYGFPFVPYICGGFAYECTDEEMAVEISKLKDIMIDNRIDIFAAHSPLYGIMDRESTYGQRYGNSHLLNFFQYNEGFHLPQAFLSGHIHDCDEARVQTITINNKDILFSNAATTVNMLNLDL